MLGKFGVQRVTLAIFLIFFSLTSANLKSQTDPEFDEVSVFLSIPRVGGADLSAVVSEEKVFLSVTEFFSLLKIKNSYSPGFDTVSGFILDERAEYFVFREKNQIVYNKKTFDLKPGSLIRTETGIYLESSYFGQIFGLDCQFNFRGLTITLNSKIELPLIKEMRVEQMRKNLSQIKGEIKADSTINGTYPLFRLGVADWTILSFQQVKGSVSTKASLNLGGVVAGGEVTARLNYESDKKFNERDQYYEWRFVNNNFGLMKQLTLGKFSAESISTLNSPILGLTATNSPTTYRSSYGSYKLNDFTEPDWTVELYVNNVLLDYKKADASGFFSFDVPLVYGSTDVKLKFYGPFGEERLKEKIITIPFNFLPKGVFEYNITAGVLRDSASTRFSRGGFDFGINRNMTLGAGVEYLSSLDSLPFIPYVNGSLRLFSGIMLSGEYAHNVRSKGVLSATLFKDVQLEMNYIKYDRSQKAVKTTSLEERRVSLSIPFKTSDIYLFTKLSYGQVILANSKYTNADFLLSGAFFGVNTNLTTTALFPAFRDPIVSSNLSLSYLLPASASISQQIQYNFSQNRFVSSKSTIEKKFLKTGYLNLSFERNFQGNFNNIELGLRVDFNFAQVSVSARRSGKNTVITEAASGSLMADARSGVLSAGRRASVGMGGIVVFPFLDMNNNGKQDKGEPKIAGLKVSINGGRVETKERDTLLRVYDLQPYTNYLLALDGSSFDNISWKIKNRNLSVAVDPNQFKLIKVPVVVMGEAAGTVYMGSGNSLKGQGRITVNFYRKDMSKISSTLSESDGYFTYMGLAPGEYFVGLDSLQMQKLNMTVAPSLIPVTISQSREGDYIDGLEFIITSNAPLTQVDTLAKQEQVANPVQVKKSEQVAKKEQVASLIKEKPDNLSDSVKIFRVQVVATKKQVNIEEYFKTLLLAFPELKIVELYEEDGLYHYCCGEFSTSAQALVLQRKLRDSGWKDCFVTAYKGSKRNDSLKWSYTPSAGELYYTVQLIAVSYQLDTNDSFSKILSLAPNLTITESKGTDGLYRYHSQPFKTLSQAKSYMELLKRAGWEDSFIRVNKPTP